MTNPEYEDTEEFRSSIWTVSSTDLAKFFLIYTLIYVCGSGFLVWLQLKRDAAPHDVASGIITGVSLIGIGIAPSLALVLTETWRLAMIFARALERKLEAKWKKEDEEREKERERNREEYRQQLIEEGIAIGEKRGYEKGVKDTLAKIHENGPDDTSE